MAPNWILPATQINLFAISNATMRQNRSLWHFLFRNSIRIHMSLLPVSLFYYLLWMWTFIFSPCLMLTIEFIQNAHIKVRSTFYSWLFASIKPPIGVKKIYWKPRKISHSLKPFGWFVNLCSRTRHKCDWANSTKTSECNAHTHVQSERQTQRHTYVHHDQNDISKTLFSIFLAFDACWRCPFLMPRQRNC